MNEQMLINIGRMHEIYKHAQPILTELYGENYVNTIGLLTSNIRYEMINILLPIQFSIFEKSDKKEITGIIFSALERMHGNTNISEVDIFKRNYIKKLFDIEIEIRQKKKTCFLQLDYYFHSCALKLVIQELHALPNGKNYLEARNRFYLHANK
jgi:hypothetical protein